MKFSLLFLLLSFAATLYLDLATGEKKCIYKKDRSEILKINLMENCQIKVQAIHTPSQKESSIVATAPFSILLFPNVESSRGQLYNYKVCFENASCKEKVLVGAKFVNSFKNHIEEHLDEQIKKQMKEIYQLGKHIGDITEEEIELQQKIKNAQKESFQELEMLSWYLLLYGLEIVAVVIFPLLITYLLKNYYLKKYL